MYGVSTREPTRENTKRAGEGAGQAASLAVQGISDNERFEWGFENVSRHPPAPPLTARRAYSAVYRITFTTHDPSLTPQPQRPGGKVEHANITARGCILCDALDAKRGGARRAHTQCRSVTRTDELKWQELKPQQRSICPASILACPPAWRWAAGCPRR
eukprot:6353392-Prymnesium_polylepis.1